MLPASMFQDSNLRWWRIECRFATAAIVTAADGETIIATAPIFKRWRGQRLTNLRVYYNALVTEMK